MIYKRNLIIRIEIVSPEVVIIQIKKMDSQMIKMLVIKILDIQMIKMLDMVLS